MYIYHNVGSERGQHGLSFISKIYYFIPDLQHYFFHKRLKLLFLGLTFEII